MQNISSGKKMDTYRRTMKKIKLDVSTYLWGLWYALLNQPLVVVKQEIVKVPMQPEHLAKLDRVFKKINYHEGLTLTEIAYNAGQCNVVDYLHRWSEGRGIQDA